MPCREFVERVTDFLEGALAVDGQARFEMHLGECPHCALYLDQMRTTLRLSGRLTAEDVPLAGRDDLLNAFRHWRDRRT